MKEDYFITHVGRKDSILPVVVEKQTDPFIIRVDAEGMPKVDSSRVTEKFQPIINRLSEPIALEAFVIGPNTVYYEVLEGIYTVAKDGQPGILKLKVKKKYGKQLRK